MLKTDSGVRAHGNNPRSPGPRASLGSSSRLQDQYGDHARASHTSISSIHHDRQAIDVWAAHGSETGSWAAQKAE
jgi:hypothetical protein